MAIVFSKVGDNKVLIKDGSMVIAGLSIFTNVVEHPLIDAVIITNEVNPFSTLNSSENGLIIKVADVTTPVCTDKSDLAEELTTNYFN